MFGVPEPVTQRVFILNMCADRQAQCDGVSSISLQAHDRHAVRIRAQAALQVCERVSKLQDIARDPHRHPGYRFRWNAYREGDIHQLRWFYAQIHLCYLSLPNRSALLKWLIHAIEAVCDQVMRTHG